MRQTIYGLMGLSTVGQNQVNSTTATGFMIAPGILATAAHFCHVSNDVTKPTHERIEVIRSSDIGQRMETAQLLAEDSDRDLAFLQIPAPRSSESVILRTEAVLKGTPCGSLGFPLASVSVVQGARRFDLVERFQSAS